MELMAIDDDQRDNESDSDDDVDCSYSSVTGITANYCYNLP